MDHQIQKLTQNRQKREKKLHRFFKVEVFGFGLRHRTFFHCVSINEALSLVDGLISSNSFAFLEFQFYLTFLFSDMIDVLFFFLER